MRASYPHVGGTKPGACGLCQATPWGAALLLKLTLRLTPSSIKDGPLGGQDGNQASQSRSLLCLRAGTPLI